ncbi:hypothetical protein J421_3691 [Gemmatirosa kalamazoonensis]|uniref:DUF4397 domain-containing protein n=1 Tax=Gemmatirosa kalamazoonensis TaxID=861299 RepID=W0RP50_9BACT|nr:DUF4397 domain-containing protein [Gemmatirosa kalamazoonensis]AHG91228.1 hypothetical protein J421_3691 [Gemmatirosa kalamazoonensis]
MNRNRNRTLAALLVAAALTGCSGDGVQQITAPTAGAFVKFFNFAVGAPGVDFYANEQKITAVSTGGCTPPNNPACLTTGLPSTTGVASGSAGNGGLYNEIVPGQYTFQGRIAAATDNGLAISSVAGALADGKYYSYYTSGIYDAATKKADAFLIEDVLPTSTGPSIVNVRFVNAISNSTPMTLFVKDSAGVEHPIGGAVPYKTAGAFAAIPGGTYDLVVRAGSTAAALISRAAVSFPALSGGRAFTVAARGDMTVTSTTAANRPQLDNTANR